MNYHINPIEECGAKENPQLRIFGNRAEIFLPAWGKKITPVRKPSGRIW